jgi:NADH-quinone oxidoreductase subunit N
VGFLGKFLIFKSAIASGQWLLIAIGILAVAAGFYYYFKVIAAMYWQEPNDSTPIEISPLTRLAVTGLGALVIILGIFPSPVLSQLQDMHHPPARHVVGM